MKRLIFVMFIISLMLPIFAGTVDTLTTKQVFVLDKALPTQKEVYIGTVFQNLVKGLTIGNTIFDSLQVTRLASLKGNTLIGDSNSDFVSFNARSHTAIVPDTTLKRDLGTSALVWKNFFIDSVYTRKLTVTGTATVSMNVTSSDFADSATVAVNSKDTDTTGTKISTALGNRFLSSKIFYGGTTYPGNTSSLAIYASGVSASATPILSYSNMPDLASTITLSTVADSIKIAIGSSTDTSRVTGKAIKWVIINP